MNYARIISSSGFTHANVEKLTAKVRLSADADASPASFQLVKSVKILPGFHHFDLYRDLGYI